MADSDNHKSITPKWRYNHKRRRAYHKYKLDYCQACNFKPVHTCQLDIDHIDGNHDNHSQENLQTLCANCHRLKSHMDRKSKLEDNAVIK